MIDINYSPQHFIQRYILNVLRHNETARFKDLRPPKVDSNAFSYHLTQLDKQDFVKKTETGYTLTVRGLAYIDRVSSLDTRPRRQPKIMTITAVVNEFDEILVRYKATQPMINKVTMPCGMLHMEDASITEAALREVKEKVDLKLQSVDHIGDCYMAVKHEGVIIMNTLMHVFTAKVTKANIATNESSFWRKQEDLLDAASATKHIVELLPSINADSRFFEEYVEEL